MNAKDQISPRELLFSAAAYIQASSLLTAFVTGVLMQSCWVGVLAAYLLSLALLAMLLFLFSKYPGLGLAMLNEAVFGRVLGKIITLFYCFFFFSLIPLNAADLNGFVGSYILPETPPAAIIAPACWFAFWRRARASTPFSRVGPLFSVSQIIILAVFTLMLIPNMKPANMLPVLALPARDFLQGVHTLAMLPFGDMFIVLLAIPP
jgi:spore germination protein KB